MKPTPAERAFNVANYAVFGILIIATLYPLWYTLIVSVIPFYEYARTPFLLFPRHIDFEAYKTILAVKIFINSLKLTVIVTVVGAFASLLVTSMAGYALSKSAVPGVRLLTLMIVFTMLFGGGLIPQYVIMSRLGLINTYGVYIVWPLVNAFYLIIIRTSFKSIPQSVEDSAKIDGCGYFTIYVRIVLPMSVPVMAAIGLFYSVDKWNTLTTALYFVRDVTKQTLQAILLNIVTRYSQSEAMGGLIDTQAVLIAEKVKAAAIIIATVPILLVYPFLQKHFVKGVMIGALKG